MTVEIFYIILAIIVGILAYFHYIIDKQRTQIDALWLQIAILAGSTAEKLTELKKEIKKDDK
jgi:hypothetical protein